MNSKLPGLLAILLYILIYLLRWQQGGWEVQLDLFPTLRQTLSHKIDQFLPSPHSQLLSGILLGQKQHLPIDFRLALRDTSTLHIVVVSGQNLSLLAGFFLSLAGLVSRKVAIGLVVVAILVYVILTGGQIPTLRAAIMVLIACLAQVFGRQASAVWALILTAGLMLLVNPLWIQDLSFQLTFLATLGLVVVAPILLTFLKFLPLIGQDLAVTLGAQAMVIPVIAQNFHQISLIGILANIMVAWTIPFIMILGSILLLVSLFSQLLGQLMALVVGVLLTYFIYLVQFFTSLPFAWEYVGEQVWIVWAGYYMLLASVMLLLKNAKTTDREGFTSSC